VATVQQLTDRLRAEIGDTARAFTDTFTGDGVTYRYQLSTAPVQGYSLQVTVNGVNKSNFVTVEEGVGMLDFGTANIPPNNSVIKVVGQSYRYFTDSEISYYIHTGFLEHARGATDTSGARINQIDLLPPIEEYPVVLLASTLALYTLATDSAFDIDIISPDGVSIPRSERFRQLNEMLEIRRNQYKELCAMLGIGLYRIEVMTLRRISRLTNRLIPVYRPQEVDDHSLPQRVRLNIPNYGDTTPQGTAMIRDLTAYAGDSFTAEFQFQFDISGYTPKSQVRLFSQGSYAQVGPAILAEFTIVKFAYTNSGVIDSVRLSLPKTVTDDLPPTAYYDLQMTAPDQTVRTYLTGKIFTEREVTK
jgi:hypothetical protein